MTVIQDVNCCARPFRSWKFCGRRGAMTVEKKSAVPLSIMWLKV